MVQIDSFSIPQANVKLYFALFLTIFSNSDFIQSNRDNLQRNFYTKIIRINIIRFFKLSSKDNNSHEIKEKDLKYREKQCIDIPSYMRSIVFQLEILQEILL